MEPDDQRVVQQCTRPTRLQLSLEVVGARIEFSDTPYSAAAQTWPLSCRASFLPPRGPSSRQRLVRESPRNLSMKNPGLDVGVAVTPHVTKILIKLLKMQLSLKARADQAVDVANQDLNYQDFKFEVSKCYLVWTDILS
jgi:hypothetical protein